MKIAFRTGNLLRVFARLLLSAHTLTHNNNNLEAGVRSQGEKKSRQISLWQSDNARNKCLEAEKNTCFFMLYLILSAKPFRLQRIVA
jgi:hypothetical protein